MINEISNAVSPFVDLTTDEDVSRGEKLEELLTIVVNAIGQVGVLTEDKADVELLTSIVATYIISKGNGSLDEEEDVKTPAYLFDEIVFPQLDNYEEPTVEEIPEDEELTGLPA